VFGRVSDKGSFEEREQPVGFQTAEALGRFHHACRRPAERHGGIRFTLRQTRRAVPIMFSIESCANEMENRMRVNVVFRQSRSRRVGQPFNRNRQPGYPSKRRSAAATVKYRMPSRDGEEAHGFPVTASEREGRTCTLSPLSQLIRSGRSAHIADCVHRERRCLVVLFRRF
jgi:hypothetical protein